MTTTVHISTHENWAYLEALKPGTNEPNGYRAEDGELIPYRYAVPPKTDRTFTIQAESDLRISERKPDV